MKTLIVSVCLFLTVSFSFSQEQSYKIRKSINLNNGKNKSLPNIVNTESATGNYAKLSESKSIGFPLFPGFPLEVDGSNETGGIYCQMDADSDLEIVYALYQKIYAWNIDGTIVPGWPVTFSSWMIGAPAYGDIDGDGAGEVVLSTRDFNNNTGNVCAFKLNGTPVTGFPINTGLGYPLNSIVLSDLDNDNSLEIITNISNSGIGQILVYEGNGSVYPGWPKTLNDVIGSSSAVGDITGGGGPEIISTSLISVYAFDIHGNILPGFPFNLPNSEYISYSSPVLADLDNNNTREISFGIVNETTFEGNVYVLNNNGTVYPGWPKSTSGPIFVPVLTADINENNVLDIIVGDLSGNLNVWDRNGNNIPGFPVTGLNSVYNQAAAGDINNDNHIEIIIDENLMINGISRLLAFNGNGTPVSGWPLELPGFTFRNFPSLGDLNHDGILDIVCAVGNFCTQGGDYTNIFAFNTGMNYNPSKIVNPMWQFNSRHSGVYGDHDIIGINNSNSEIPGKFNLEQNYPNPFNPLTHIKYDLPVSSLVTLKVFDITGREVASLINGNQNAGRYNVEWNASQFASGTYFYKIVAGENVQVKRMILLK